MAGPWEQYQQASGPWERYVQPPETFDPSEGMSRTDKFLAGAGKGMTDLARGAGQMLGMVSDADIAESRKRDAPLMDSGYATAGNIVGQTAPLALAALIPGANTYAGSALIGAGAGALQPVAGDESRIANTALGAAGGVAGQKVGNVLSSKIASNISNAATSRMANATRDATLKQSKDAGYHVPRSLYDPTFASNRLESLAGKAATKQQAAVANQQVTNNLARQYLGIAPDTPLDQATLEALRDTHAAAYREAAALPSAYRVGVNSASSKTGAQLVDEIKTARDVSRAAWKAFNSGTANSPTKALKEAKRADKLVGKLENELETLAQKNGKSDIVKNLRDARVNIAKVHTVENALNDATGDVSARTVFAQGKRLKLTDQAKTIADFAKAFPQVAQNGAGVPAAGVSKVEAIMAALLAGGGGSLFGPVGISAAGLTAVPHMVRPLAVNGAMPKYGSAVASAAAKKMPLVDASLQDMLPYLGTIGGGLLGANY